MGKDGDIVGGGRPREIVGSGAEPESRVDVDHLGKNGVRFN